MPDAYSETETTETLRRAEMGRVQVTFVSAVAASPEVEGLPADQEVSLKGTYDIEANTLTIHALLVSESPEGGVQVAAEVPFSFPGDDSVSWDRFRRADLDRFVDEVGVSALVPYLRAFATDIARRMPISVPEIGSYIPGGLQRSKPKEQPDTEGQ